MSTIYSLSEVEKHNVKGDLWLAIEGKVYNVTTFAADHPGGERAIYEEAGKDATDAFNDIGHSEAAHEWLNDYYIGDLEGFAQAEEKKVEEQEELKQEPVTQVPVQKPKGSSLRVIIPAIAIAGILIYKFVIAPQQKN
ncbi:cytochrome-b5 reductase [Mucor circinelloides 1006PhL]|uniref:Cytochrome-b5 reductase n=1 Tax=Mucor circinelloides f. circinelloides (strain 1006PhL) TaxID=1220926 RepID=S2JPX2_MUCC1|nr:cytochrome-b5 reductase [Mucor circinelloides 1006PhL]